MLGGGEYRAQTVRVRVRTASQTVVIAAVTVQEAAVAAALGAPVDQTLRVRPAQLTSTRMSRTRRKKQQVRGSLLHPLGPMHGRGSCPGALRASPLHQAKILGLHPSSLHPQAGEALSAHPKSTPLQGRCPLDLPSNEDPQPAHLTTGLPGPRLEPRVGVLSVTRDPAVPHLTEVP